MATTIVASVAVTEALSRRVHETVRSLIRPGDRCALVDFPVQANAGDSAIWMGERLVLRRLGATVVYACHQRSYSADTLRRRLPRGTILIHGGGNLGDVWPEAQRFRERVIADFPDHRIVQFPQGIHFGDRAGATRAAAALNRHPNLTLLVRDRQSLAFAQAEFRARSVLCPDMAFALRTRATRATATAPVLWLRRSDKESALAPGDVIDHRVPVADWQPARHAGAWAAWLQRQVVHPSWLLRAPPVSPVYDLLARQRVRRGIALLRRGRVVVTDRLHGHVLCTILGIPHVLLDTRFGKIRSFYETWTAAAGLAEWAATPAEALARARAMARRA